jgi:hypothetical protein
MPGLGARFIDNSAGMAAAGSKDAAVPCLEGPLAGAGRAGGVRKRFRTPPAPGILNTRTDLLSSGPRSCPVTSHAPDPRGDSGEADRRDAPHVRFPEEPSEDL